MSHEHENPLIIDVVGEVEPPQTSEQQAPKKVARSTEKKGFFKKSKKTNGTMSTQAASEAEVDAAKRAAVAASVPSVQGPTSHAAAAQNTADQAEPQVEAVAFVQPEQFVSAEAAQADEPRQDQDVIQSESAPAQVTQPARSSAPQPAAVQPQPVPMETPQVQVPLQQSGQPSVQQPITQPAPQQSVAQSPASGQLQVPLTSQPQAIPPVVQPPQQAVASVPLVAPQVQSVPMGTVAADPQRSRAVYVFAILAAAVVLLALAMAGFFMFTSWGDRSSLTPVSQADLDSNEVRPIGSVSLDQASKVSLRATAEGWNEETSTPVIAYIKRVDDVSGSDDDERGDAGSDTERYFAFAPNKNASVSLPAGRYTFSFIAPMNSDGSMYSVPDMVNMVVGDGGMAVLPVDLTLIPKSDLTQEQVTRALAQLKTASEKGGESFDYEPFKKSIDLALSTWFPQSDTTTEQPATDLTQEQQDALNAQADSQSSQAKGNGSNASSVEHAHDWIAQHEQRWEPEIVPVIDTAAWESPVYARYRCQEGILFETLEACLAHVRERGNEPYTESNEIIRIDYHPAVVHYEEQGRYVDVVTGYRCSICGVRGTLS